MTVMTLEQVRFSTFLVYSQDEAEAARLLLLGDSEGVEVGNFENQLLLFNPVGEEGSGRSIG